MPTYSLESTGLDIQVAKAAYTADQTPANGLDVHLFNARGIVIDLGAWTDGTFAFDVEESDDDSTYTSVDASDLSMTPPTIDDATTDGDQYKITYSGTKKYIRGVVTVTGSPATGLEFGIYGQGADKVSYGELVD